jgi:squalene-hopene/tetraprenyl-beta-curcumene cyclase
VLVQIPLRLGRIDNALALAVRFLLRQQSADGAWRSDTYGAFKDGYSLTPLVVHTLLTSGEHEAASAVENGIAFLSSAVGPDGSIDTGAIGLSYPVYTAALTLLVLSTLPGFGRERAAWRSYLAARQLTERLGWHPGDREYGGWGYSQGLPRKPQTDTSVPPFTESNLSATVLAVEALAGIASDDPALKSALQFIWRCQNYSDEIAREEPEFDDGGFFFIYDDPVRNKAGLAGRDRTGRQRYSSYGSMTADGLRGLLRCGLPLDAPRVTAARRWLEKNFTVATNPGNFAAGREALRASAYYYYCWSLARTMAVGGVQDLATAVGGVLWSEALAEELARRQQPEGCWVNDAAEMREDDPILATSMAAGALAVCRQFRARPSP